MIFKLNKIMVMRVDLEKLSEISKKRSDESINKAKARKANREWLRMSQEIALCLHYYLRKSGMNQKDLADMLKVSPAYVGKLLKGSENLTLETIFKIQESIGKKLITVYHPYEYSDVISVYKVPTHDFASKSSIYESVSSNINGFIGFTGSRTRDIA